MSKATPLYIDLFAGCGGLSLGFYNSNKWRGLLAIEKSPLAFETFQFNLLDRKRHFAWPAWFPKQASDIRTVLRDHKNELAELRGKIDLVTGGPPCQGFSMAGKRLMTDKRNNLVRDYLRFVEIVKPRLIFFENVKGFTIPFESDKKSPSNSVISRLRVLGYNVDWRLIDFSEFGIPQRRHRFILVGTLNGNASSFFEQIEKRKKRFLGAKRLPTNASTIDGIGDLARQHGVVEPEKPAKFAYGNYGAITSRYQKYLSEKVDRSIRPDSHRFANHTAEKEAVMKLLLATSRRGKKVTEEIREKFKMKKHSVTILDPHDKAPTLTTLPDDCLHYSEPRILTVREYARLQSFPDWFEFKGKYTTGGILRKKETPRYTQVGNAIPPLFAELAGRVLFEMSNE